MDIYHHVLRVTHTFRNGQIRVCFFHLGLMTRPQQFNPRWWTNFLGNGGVLRMSTGDTQTDLHTRRGPWIEGGGRGVIGLPSASLQVVASREREMVRGGTPYLFL